MYALFKGKFCDLGVEVKYYLKIFHEHFDRSDFDMYELENYWKGSFLNDNAKHMKTAERMVYETPSETCTHVAEMQAKC
jgi:hypothetical protein